ncbi:hypothetical protein NPIL_181081 [Nephila pilipes]|uniref:Uncharacterized protein n=1 Tax=Nephila pilipes TaxID=299642 RepID=A0A8X6K9C6_NEPPI|nr:hypothetical protein NPIL_181081 [Nephila pilipes]
MQNHSGSTSCIVSEPNERKRHSTLLCCESHGFKETLLNRSEGGETEKVQGTFRNFVAPDRGAAPSKIDYAPLLISNLESATRSVGWKAELSRGSFSLILPRPPGGPTRADGVEPEHSPIPVNTDLSQLRHWGGGPE